MEKIRGRASAWGKALLASIPIVAVLAVVVLAEGGYSLDWWTVDGGGGTFIGGSYALSSAIGQPDAGSISGGRYALAGGLWTRALAVANDPPQTMSVSPGIGWSRPAALLTFSAVYSDPNGCNDLRYAELLINTTECKTKCIYLRYDAQANRMYIRRPDDAKWQGGGAPGSAGTIKNSYVILDYGRSAVVADTYAMTVTWAFTPTGRTSGKQHNLYLRAEDVGGLGVGWTDHGDWTINRMPNWLIPPGRTTYYDQFGNPEPLFPVKAIGYVGVKYWLDPAYRDSDREWTLDELYFLIADSRPDDDDPDSQFPDGVYLKYVHNGDVDNGQLYVWNGWQWLGPYDPYDRSGPVETTVATIITRWSRSMHADFRTIKLFWRIQFKATFIGTHRLYMRAVDTMGPENGGDTGWKFKGWIEIAP